MADNRVFEFSFQTFIFTFSLEIIIRACNSSPSSAGVNLIDYVSPTNIMDRWENIVEWAKPPWYDPLGFLQQVVIVAWWLLREVFLKSPVFWIVTMFFLLRWAHNDFYRYLAVGRGGTPSTFSGWCKVKVLHFISHYIFRVDIFGAPFLGPLLEPYRGRLFDLPPRQNGRPTIIGLVPQRQATQTASPEREAAINDTLERKAAENPRTLVMEQSYLEGHLRALKRRLPAGAVPGAIGTAAEWGGEIVHAHYESSAHAILHPADAAEVVRAGWGERHPLACCADHWLWRFYHHTLMCNPLPLPPSFVLLYAPRDRAEMAMFERIVDAAVWFHTLPQSGEDAGPTRPGPAPRDAPSHAPGSSAPTPNST